MNYSAIRNFDIANGEGVRLTLFVSGCTNNCPGCFNPEEQDFNYGEKYDASTVTYLHTLLVNPVNTGLSILGGDPLCQDDEGLLALIDLCKFTHHLNKNVWLWTGYTWEDVHKNGRPLQVKLLDICDIVVDGPFIISESDMKLKWKGSANQRVIDVKETLQSNIVTLYNN